MEKTICIFGDSITWGACDSEKGGWCSRLRYYLENYNYETHIYNCGISGDDTDGLLRRFRIECEAREPDIIIIAIGINDSQYLKSENSNKVPVPRFKKNLNKIIHMAKKFASEIIFLGLVKIDESKTSPTEWNSDSHYTEKNAELYNSTISFIAENNGCSFISIDDLINNTDLEDGLHPNAQGHEKIYSKVCDFVLENKLLEE